MMVPMSDEERKFGVGVGALILEGNKVLLGLRNPDPKKAKSALHGEGTWTMPGGKLHFGEGLEACVKREVEEETGIRVRSVALVSVANSIAGNSHFVTIGFLVKEWDGELRTMEPEEIVEWRWFDLDELPSAVFPPSSKVLENYRRGIIFSE